MKLIDWLSRFRPAGEERSLENPSTPLSAPDPWLFDALGAKIASGPAFGKQVPDK